MVRAATIAEQPNAVACVSAACVSSCDRFDVLQPLLRLVQVRAALNAALQPAAPPRQLMHCPAALPAALPTKLTPTMPMSASASLLSLQSACELPLPPPPLLLAAARPVCCDDARAEDAGTGGLLPGCTSAWHSQQADARTCDRTSRPHSPGLPRLAPALWLRLTGWLAGVSRLRAGGRHPARHAKPSGHPAAKRSAVEHGLRRDAAARRGHGLCAARAVQPPSLLQVACRSGGGPIGNCTRAPWAGLRS